MSETPLERPVTHCPECRQPAPADAAHCPHCRHAFGIYARPASLPPQPSRPGKGLRKRLRRS